MDDWNLRKGVFRSLLLCFYAFREQELNQIRTGSHFPLGQFVESIHQILGQANAQHHRFVRLASIGPSFRHVVYCSRLYYSVNVRNSGRNRGSQAQGMAADAL